MRATTGPRATTDDLLVENGDTQERTDHEWTYRAGLSYVTPFGLAPYVSYSTSFLPTGGTDFEGNQFEPTEGRQYEVGLKYKPTWFNGFFAVAAYDLVKENVVGPDPDNGPFALTQVGEVRSRGIEVEANASLMAGLDLTLAYAYNDAEVTKDNPDATGVSREGKEPTLAPSHLASAWLDYTFQGTFLRGLLLGGGARYVGSSYADPQNELENERLSPVRRRRPLRPRRPPRAPARRVAGPQRQQPARQGLHHLLLGLRLQLGRGPHRDRHLGLAVVKG